MKFVEQWMREIKNDLKSGLAAVARCSRELEYAVGLAERIAGPGEVVSFTRVGQRWPVLVGVMTAEDMSMSKWDQDAWRHELDIRADMEERRAMDSGDVV